MRKTGYVTAGRGMASGHIEAVLEELRALTGKDLFPGTLNLVFGSPLILSNEHAQRFDKDRRLLWPARIGDTDIWLYRWNSSPLHIVEILSEKRLRDHFEIENGGQLTITIDNLHTRKPSLYLRAVYGLIYYGRGNLYYTSKRYSWHAARVLRRCKALHQNTQRAPDLR